MPGWPRTEDRPTLNHGRRAEKFRATPLPAFLPLLPIRVTRLWTTDRDMSALTAFAALARRGSSGRPPDQAGSTSRSRPVFTSKTKPRTSSVLQQERRGAHPLDRLPHVLVGVPEGLHRPRRTLADLQLQIVPELLGDGLHAAARVWMRATLRVPERPLAGMVRERITSSVTTTARVADGAAVAELQAERGVQVQGARPW